MELAALLKYWRNCLADSEAMSPRLREDSGYRPEFSDLSASKLPLKLTNRIFRDAENQRRRRKRRKKDEGTADSPLRAVRILVAPFVLHINVEHGRRHRAQSIGRSVHAPLWLAAVLDPLGVLQGDAELAPWIGRQHLAPAGTSELQIGELDASDAFRTTHEAPETPLDWTSHLAYASSLMDAVCGQSDLENPRFEGAQATGPVILLGQAQIIAAGHLLHLYDLLRDEPTECSPLLRSLSLPTASGRQGIQADRPPAADRHLGHMADRFGLQPSQRKALRAGLSLEEGELLAINGPPGTGKTTLLQSVVASLWVERAIEGGDPPLVHACTSNNRAIVNILETFARAQPAGKDERSDFETRWIDGIRGYGLLMPTKRVAEKYDGRFEIALKDFLWDGLPARIEDRAFLDTAERTYLRRAVEALGPHASRIDRAVASLRERLVFMRRQLDQLLGTAGSVWSHRRTLGVTTRMQALDKLQNRRGELEQEIRVLQELPAQVEEAIGSITFWEDLLSFLPPIKSRRDDRLLAPFRQAGLEPPAKLSLAGYRDELRAFATRSVDELRAELDRIRGWIEEEESLLRQTTQVVEALRLPATEASRLVEHAIRESDVLEALLDRSYRRQMFHLAGRYWEGRWVQTIGATMATDPEFAKRQGLDACRDRLLRFAMLTPLSVSTFYLLPKLLTYFDGREGEERPMREVLDLLIVDEAGQTTPEVGAVALHYARRALLVGDVQQIEPIWGVDRALDAANRKRASLELPAKRDGEAFQSSRGSLMGIARQVSRRSDSPRGGLLLTEHWRCVPKIIDYCNELAYDGRLQPMRPAQDEPPLPPMGWAHVDAPMTRRMSSRENRGQAEVIVDWLARRAVEDWQGQALAERVGIVTPFRAQAGLINSLLRERELGEIEAGTVHTFQGGEKDVIIFSPVYDGSAKGGFFFDYGPNMLNVAVSRAKNSFLVFGDMEIFRPSLASPSGLLARRLFQEPEQELTDLNVDALLRTAAVPMDLVERIDTLEDHRRQLRSAFEGARDRLLIVSPYLTPNAVRDDGVAELVARCVARKVEVKIAYCRDLMRSREQHAREVSQALEQAGAQVWALDRIHNKTIAVDTDWIVEGSFNWLSASRQPKSAHHRHEVSMLCRAPNAVSMIEKAWEKVEQRSGAAH